MNLTDFMILAGRVINFDKKGDFLVTKSFKKRKLKTIFNFQRSGKYFELQRIIPTYKLLEFYTIFDTYCFFGRN